MNPKSRSSSPHARFGAPRRVATRLVVYSVLFCALILSGCSAAIGLGAVAVAGIVAYVGYGCGEPVDVTVWDRKTAHPICDATVTAEQDGSSHEFSPCYRLHLGDGAWKVKASKPGYVTAVGSVTVNKERRCSEPTFHTVVLTLLPEGEPAPAPVMPPAPAAPGSPAPPASVAPAPSASAAPAPSASAAPAGAPGTAPSAKLPALPAPASP
jgi:hypothetical protein